MNAIQPYLNFAGNARAAMEFYQKCLGGELAVQTFGEVNPAAPKGTENLVMHARLTNGSVILMASDTQPGTTFSVGNNVHVTIDCETVAELEKIFAALSEGGTVSMAPQDTFWGARFAMLADKFSVYWMLNCNLPTTS
jgi:PhnB protein